MLTQEQLHAVHRVTHQMALRADTAGEAVTKFAERVGTASIAACANGSAEAQVYLLRDMEQQIPAVDVAVTAWLRSLKVSPEALDEISDKFRLLASKLATDAYTIERAINGNGVEQPVTDQFVGGNEDALIRAIFGDDVEIIEVADVTVIPRSLAFGG